MPVEQVPGSDLRYYLVAFDKNGAERTDDPGGAGGRLSARLADEASSPADGRPWSDLFVFSHGWKGDVAGARDQYNRWIRAMAACTADLARMRNGRAHFNPLLVGLHWPSLPWGDENLAGAASFGLAPGAPSPSIAGDPIGPLVDLYADRIADTPAARAALRVILTAAMDDTAPVTLPAEVRSAYAVLDRESGLGASGVAGDPGSDREPFDAEQRYQLARRTEAAAFGTVNLGGLLSPLRQLSYWTMKDRARQFGEGGAGSLIAMLQGAGGEGLRVHLMGHSFGCIVVSGILRGPGARPALRRPVQSASLVQGAMSLWSYCSDIPGAPGTPGYFRAGVANHMVSGALLTTQSVYDTAVGKFYPLASGLAGQVAFAPGELPTYGAIGAYGIRGPGCDIVDLDMMPANGLYAFEPGRIYNLNGSQYITGGDGPSGAHSNIDRPEVAHAVWSAAWSA